MTDLLSSLDKSTESIQVDRWGRYKLPHPETGKVQSWTRATTWAKSISDMYGLMQWSNRMVAKGIASRRDLYALAAATPVDDKKTFDEVCEKAKEAAQASSGANLGSALHSFTEAVDRGETPDIPEPWDRDIAAYREALSAHNIRVIPEFIERVVVVPELGVAGKLDRIVNAGPLLIADVKTGKNVQYAWAEIAIQLAIYANATHVWDPATGSYQPMPDLWPHHAIVMHLPAGAARCDLYEVDTDAGWQAAKLCGAVRKWRNRRDELATPYERPTPVVELDDVDDKPVVVPWFDRIKAAVSPNDLAAIWLEADAAGEWTDVHTAAAKRRKKELAR